jgi:hypothetical protein
MAITNTIHTNTIQINTVHVDCHTNIGNIFW